MDNKMVETVLGPVKGSDLGRTLTHEHLSMDFAKFYVAPPNLLKDFFQEGINIRNVGMVKQYPYSSAYNVNVYDLDAVNAVIDDLKFYKKSGGGTIVENTTCGIRRDISALKKISNDSGVHVIAGTGHYVALTQDHGTLSTTEEKLYDLMTKELTIGCEGNEDVKAGIVGEIGSSWPIEDFEKRAIRATAQVQASLKCPVTFHPGRNPAAPFEILRIYAEAGGDIKKAIMSHLDRTIKKDEDLLEFAKLNSYCQFDLFGTECSFYQLHPEVDMPSDAQRVDKAKLLKENGYLEKILLSHDIHTKHRLMTFGGHGYSHIINNVFPKMLIKGFTQDEIDRITKENPKTWLCS